MKLKSLITPEPSRDRTSWFFPVEISMMIYALFTLLLIVFTYTSQPDAEALMWWRVRTVALTVALWIVYRMWPCRLMVLARIALLLLTLSWWYPDTYLLNCHLPNLDHVFAQWEQSIFGFQPALVWSQKFSSALVSELMTMGYSLYFLMFVSLVFITFFRKYQDFQRVSFVIISSFFVYYVIFVLVPVAGPQYYYLAVGLDNIAAGHFPQLAPHYFASHLECLPIPGWEDGLFHNLVQMSHNAGERPTAAFPSSHAAVATLTMICAIRQREWIYLVIFAVPYAFLVMGTVYIQAHYAVDAIAGVITAVPVFFLLEWAFPRVRGKRR